MKFIIIVVIILPLISGCATVVHGTLQKIPVTSEPSNADVSVDGTKTYHTPVILELERRKDHLIKITKKGFKPVAIKLIHSLSGVILGNVFTGGPIGWGIDALTGAQYKLTPENVHVNLEPEGIVTDSVSDNDCYVNLETQNNLSYDQCGKN